ncbi:MAG: hypothetical protein KDD13_00345 [Mangrovimonas sp.]|nr:hypothetical protein [Mangrovimonas sp.]
MSSRYVKPEIIVDDADISSNYTKIIELGGYESVLIQFVWTTSDVNGAFTIGVSNDGGTTYDNLADSAGDDISIAVAGSSSSYSLHITDCKALDKARLLFTNSSGSTGTVDIYMSAVRMV